MSKKILNVEGIKNELEGASLYFARPSTPLSPTSGPVEIPNPTPPVEISQQPEIKTRKLKVKPTSGEIREIKINNVGSNGRTFERTNERPDDLLKYSPKRRSKIRHAFDIFADQLISLREIAIKQEKMFGDRVLLGDLAQQALDMLITKEKNK